MSDCIAIGDAVSSPGDVVFETSNLCLSKLDRKSRSPLLIQPEAV